jgi:pyruvate-formate lyase-activating enzyme
MRGLHPPKIIIAAAPATMRLMISLPVISRSEPIPTRRIDRSKPYASCEWLEGGLAFNRRSLHACLIVHHGRGFPHLCDFNGGEIDVNHVLAKRAKIIADNQSGGHDACFGCPHLKKRRWPEPRYPFRLLGIAQFTRCNIECNYCYLQNQDPASFAGGDRPYSIIPAISALLRDRLLDPAGVADWGGGEPTIYPEFDAVLTLLTEHGLLTWIHTNGTRLPRPIKNGLSTKRIHILCSVDAGTRETWKLIKNKDLLPIVWRTIRDYLRLGCRVVLKYIVKEENCSELELRAFTRRAARLGVKELVIDIDYNFPQPSPQVLAGIRLLQRLAAAKGIYATFGATGALFRPEIHIDSKATHADLRLRERSIYLSLLARRLTRRIARLR